MSNLFKLYKDNIKWSDTDGNWYFSFYHNGTRIHRHSRKWIKSKKYLAEEKLKEICKNLEESSVTKPITVNEVFKEFIKFKRNRPNTVKTLERVYNNHIKDELGSNKIDKVTVKQINLFFTNFLEKRQPNDEYYSNNMISKVQSTLNQIFHYATINDYVVKNIMLHIPVIKHNRVEKKFSRRYTTFENVLQVINKLESPTEQAAIAVSLFTGMRPSEIFGLDFGDDKGTHFTHRQSWDNETKTMGPPKNGIERLVAIPNQLRNILDDYYKALKHYDYIDSSPLIGVYRRYPKSTIDRHVNEAIEALELPKFSWYDLRSTLITDLLKAGTDPYVVAKNAGHDKSETTDTYAIVGVDQQLEAVNNLEQLRNVSGTILVPISIKQPKNKGKQHKQKNTKTL